MSHSKTHTKTKLARAKGRPKTHTKPENTPSSSSRGGTKQEAVLALLGQPKGDVHFPTLTSSATHSRNSRAP